MEKSSIPIQENLEEEWEKGKMDQWITERGRLQVNLN